MSVYHKSTCIASRKRRSSYLLGLEEMIGTDGVAIVEWPDRLGKRWPARAFRVLLKDLGGNRREIRVEDPRPSGRVRGGNDQDSVR
jgi:tRNA A37 threonylcarbamoyladenosine biosynthesis protein TsaE